MALVDIIASNPELFAACITAFAAILGVCITVGIQIRLIYLQKERDRDHEYFQERKKALFDSLSVIDHVFANESLNGQPPLNPHTWDISLARDAENRMLIYCKDPERSLTAFRRVIGLHNPECEQAPGVDVSRLVKFRQEVARELDLSPLEALDLDRIWIYSLAGTIEAQEQQKRAGASRHQATKGADHSYGQMTSPSST